MRSSPDARFLLPLSIPAAVFLLASCSTGPGPAARGTPAWYWQAAHETYEAGDLLKTVEHLDAIAKPGNEYADRAMPWLMVITGGFASGYMNLADGLEQGGRTNRAAAADFRKYMSEYRSRAERQALQFAEVFMAFQKARSQGPVPIAFGFPKGSALPVAEITKASQGIVLSTAEVSAAENRSLEREVLLTACQAVGATEDTAKAQQAFSGENPSVPPETFVLAMATKLNELAGFYTASKMDRPDRLKQLNEIALEAVKSLPENDDTKELIKKIEKTIKAAEKRTG